MATPAQPIDWQTLRTAARAAQQHSLMMVASSLDAM
jgi:hypothetical protein